MIRNNGFVNASEMWQQVSSIQIDAAAAAAAVETMNQKLGSLFARVQHLNDVRVNARKSAVILWYRLLLIVILTSLFSMNTKTTLPTRGIIL
jgi:uncharacterized membrane protein